MADRDKWVVLKDQFTEQGTVDLKAGTIVEVIAGAPFLSFQAKTRVASGFATIVRTPEGKQFSVDAVAIGLVTKTMWYCNDGKLVNILNGNMMLIPSDIPRNWQGEVLMKKKDNIWVRAFGDDDLCPLVTRFLAMNLRLSL